MNRYEKRAFGVASVATIVAVALAVGRGGTYDPTLAVLTATLIAIIWYTFFTFQAVHREAPGWVVVDLVEQRVQGMNVYMRQFVAVNPVDRVLTISPRVKVWLNGELKRDGAIVVGDKESFQLGPGEEFQQNVAIGLGQKVRDPKTNQFRHDANSPCLVELSATWKDDIGRSGQTIPKYWERTGQGTLQRLLSPSRVQELQGRGVEDSQ